MKSLGYVVIGVIATVIAAWLRGFLTQFLPPPKQAWLALKNLRWGKPPRPEDSFRVVLRWLENDSSGDDTRTVERAFTSVEGITLVRSARLVAASGAGNEWRPAMQKSTRTVLKDWNGDLAVAGLVKKSGQALSLWFVPRSGAGTLGRGDQPYQLEDVTLDADFHDDLRAQLTAVALAAVDPLTDPEVRGRVLEKGLATNTIRSCAPSGGVPRIETRTFEAPRQELATSRCEIDPPLRDQFVASFLRNYPTHVFEEIFLPRLTKDEPVQSESTL